MKFFQGQFLFAVFVMAAVTGCTQQQQSPQDLKEKTAKETAALKSDAKAVAQGVREGWNRDQSVDLNSAPKDDLVKVGLSSGEADRVIAGRPYNEPNEVVTRHILPKADYDKVADHLTAKK